MDDEKILEKAIHTFGAQMQMTVAIEELSELQKEICKQLRGVDRTVCLAEEIADVEIMLEQLKMLFDCADEVQTWRKGKLMRLECRIMVASEKGGGTL